jgi:hypothetical protein
MDARFVDASSAPLRGATSGREAANRNVRTR